MRRRRAVGLSGVRATHSPTSCPGSPTAGSASWPVASFRVDDLTAKVRELRDAGVDFLGPDDLPFELDEDGISSDTSGMRVAWMRDPDGSVLTVFSLA